jgi:hypothetical protein
MSAGTETGLVDAVRIDLRLLHETWMEFIFPRQRGATGTVLGKWTPDTTGGMVGYRLWSALGVPVVGVLYPLLLLGYFLRYQTRRLNLAAVRLGAVGVVLLFTVLWGALAVLAWVDFRGLFGDTVVPVVAASAVGILSSGLSYLCWRLDGRPVTVLFAYPFAVTALFLPPVVAALFSPALGDIVLDQSDSLASAVVDEYESFGPVEYLVENFDRRDEHHVIIWFAISVPVGWILGTLVTLADLIRPTDG